MMPSRHTVGSYNVHAPPPSPPRHILCVEQNLTTQPAADCEVSTTPFKKERKEKDQLFKLSV